MMSDHERTALIAHPESHIPWLQVIILSYARMIESWVFFSIFPYISQMVEHVGIEQSKIGFYTGLVESVFSVTQCVFMQLVWSWAGDAWGRKPVLLITLFGLSTSAVLFGLSTTVWQMILFRAIGGVFSGSLVTVRVMFSEISTPQTKARIFSFFSFAGSIAALLAPLAGGYLAQPAQHFPIFQKATIFIAYPYLLPSFFVGAVGYLAWLLCLLFLRETRPWSKEEEFETLSSIAILRSPGVTIIFIINVWASLIGFAFTTISSVFWYTRPSLGGLGLSPQSISVVLACGSGVHAILLLVAAPWLQRTYGTEGLIWISVAAFTVNSGLQPFLSMIACTSSLARLSEFLPISIVLSGIQSMVYNGIQIAITDVSPTPQAMSKLMSMFVVSILATRATVPAAATSLFALGVDRHIAGGYLVWIVLALISAGLCLYMRWFPGNAKTRHRELEEPEEVERSIQ